MRRYTRSATWAPTAHPVLLPSGSTSANKYDLVMPLIPSGDIKASEVMLADILTCAVEQNAIFTAPPGAMTQLFLATPAQWAANQYISASASNVIPQGLWIDTNPSGSALTYSAKLTGLSNGLNIYLRYWANTNTVNPTTWRGVFVLSFTGRVYANTEGIYVPFREVPLRPVPSTFLGAAIP